MHEILKNDRDKNIVILRKKFISNEADAWL